MRIPSRRLFILGALAAAPTRPAAAVAHPARLAFAAIRNGKRIGAHTMTFQMDGRDQVVRTHAEMVIKLGAVTLYRYRHEAVERWRDGRFEGLETRTSSNGTRETVTAIRVRDGVRIDSGAAPVMAPGNAIPFTHWNLLVASAPLFNPQSGKVLKLTARDLGRGQILMASGQTTEARRIAFRGDAEIDDWYDAAGVWTGLRGRLVDGSTLEYRRL